MTRKIQAVFNGETSTYYRQHSANIASPQNLKDEQILFNVAVKKNHYLAVSDLGRWHREMATRFQELEGRLMQSKNFRDSYLLRTRVAAPQTPLWWEIARLPEEIGMKSYH